MINFNTLGYLLKNLNSDITIEKLSEDLDISTSTYARLIDYKNPYKRPPNSLKFDGYIRVFKNYQKEYFQNDNDKMVMYIIDFIEKNQLSLEADISSYKTLQSISNEQFHQFIGLLLHEASSYYNLDLNDCYIETPSNKLQFQTYFDLLKKGLSAMDIVAQIMANDALLYAELGEHIGTPQQWHDHMVASPENWGFLCDGTKIIGNWSFIFLSEHQEELVKSGNFLERDFTLDQTKDVFESQVEERAIYLLNMSLNDGFQTKENQAILWREFGKRLHQLAKLGIFYKGIYTNVERLDHQVTYDELGFTFLIQNSYRGKIYYLDLMSNFPTQLSWIMPDTELEKEYDHYWGNHVVFKQLSHKDILTDKQ